ncbi:hypothetical protein [Streptosporangium amethystogenes]|uniref:hypothetical protein n=1 Tax=Streptosporangium amethystogenes TaxID=2002 RepID=UPI0004C4FF0A|nr:hypothetical protein [Streptosporangium amethystogenes]
MVWETDDCAHEGWAAAEFSDGRVSVGSETGGAVVVRWGPEGEAEPAGLLDGRDAVGWCAVCECGWRGPLWARVATPAEHDAERRRVHAAPGLHGDAPDDVEDALRREWTDHLGPATFWSAP